jgi:hypothetical protein
MGTPLTCRRVSSPQMVQCAMETSVINSDEFYH